MKKSKKIKNSVAYPLVILMLLFLLAVNVAVMFLIKNMMLFLVIFGTFLAPVLITVLLVLIDRIDENSKINATPFKTLVYVIHALSIVVISPVLSHTLSWQILTEEPMTLAQSIIASLICGAIVMVIQILIINYLCDNYFYTASAPYDYSSSGSIGYSSPDIDDSYPTISTQDDSPTFYGVSSEDGISLGLPPKKAHEKLDDLSGSFSGTNT